MMTGQGPSDTGGVGSHADLAGIEPQAENDKLLGALSYIFWIIVPVIILATDMKDSRFAKVHAYQSLVFAGIGIAFYFVYFIFSTILTAITFGLLWCVLWVGYVIPFVVALYLAYKIFTQGQVVFPYLTDLTRSLFKDL